MNRRPVILIVEDEKNTREGLDRLLRRNYTTLLADSAEQALQLLDQHPVDIVLSDLRLPGMDGLSLVKRAMAHQSQPACIILTAYGTVEKAVESLKAGTVDFLTKPVDLNNLESILRNALRARQLESENKSLRHQLNARFGLEALIGQSPAMVELGRVIRQVAPSRATVLIQGESGTGKELVANAIHGLSPRARGPFVAVHCAALPPTLLESELFGHERGAFTGATERRRGRFELAEGGTLFLDEISEIEPATQVKLLRVLEERRFERVGGQETIEADIRLITATNRDLRQLTADGQFREDLFFRLNVVTITTPTLRERVNDIPLLARRFMDELAAENGKSISGITADAMTALTAYAWPGNVRELRNAIERMVVMARGKELTLDDLPAAVRGSHGTRRLSTNGVSLQAANERLILAALEAAGGNRTLAAQRLGISRRTLHRKLNELDIPPLRAPKKDHNP